MFFKRQQYTMKRRNVSVLLDSLKWSQTIFFICLSLVSAAHLSDSHPTTWSRPEIPFNELGMMPYRSFLIPIYEHSENNKKASSLPFKKYYYAPTSILKHRSAFCDFNKVTGKYQVQFEVEMWNDEVESRVIEHLANVTKEKIERHQVQVLSFGQVILKITEPSNLFQVDSIWLPINLLTGNRKFTLACLTKKDCDDLAETMIKEPSKFQHFLLLFVPPFSKIEKKTVNISNLNSMESDIKTKLLQQFPHKQRVYLKADDLKRLVAETRSHILKEEFRDSEVVLPKSQNAIEKIVRDMILSSSKRTYQHEDVSWESVFWNEDKARPDKTSKYLNEIYSRFGQMDQSRVRQELSEANSIVNGGSQGIQGFNVSGNNEKPSYSKNSEDLTKLIKKYTENEEYVGFDGERFWPKLPVLNTIDLVKLRDTQSVQDKAVNIEYVTAILLSAININEEEEKILASNEWTTLQTSVAALTKKLDGIELQTNALSSALDINERENKKFLASDEWTTLQNSVSAITDKLHDFELQTKDLLITSSIIKHQLDDYRSVLDNMKLKRVSFYVQRINASSEILSPITFEVTRLNVGNAMNATTGIFTAPVDGVYFFFFSVYAIKLEEYGDLQIGLYLNREQISFGRIYKTEHPIPPGTILSFMDIQPLFIQSTLSLKKGDRISNKITKSRNIKLQSYEGNFNTHFTGFLL